MVLLNLIVLLVLGYLLFVYYKRKTCDRFDEFIHLESNVCQPFITKKHILTDQPNLFDLTKDDTIEVRIDLCSKCWKAKCRTKTLDTYTSSFVKENSNKNNTNNENICPDAFKTKLGLDNITFED